MKVIVTGALGKMGGILADLVEKADGLELAAGVDTFSQGGEVLKSVAEFKGEADMVDCGLMTSEFDRKGGGAAGGAR